MEFISFVYVVFRGSGCDGRVCVGWEMSVVMSITKVMNGKGTSDEGRAVEWFSREIRCQQ
jgi:hypothetical protein